jgi:TRAP-type uncharacterized transport system substrate-binding protein
MLVTIMLDKNAIVLVIAICALVLLIVNYNELAKSSRAKSSGSKSSGATHRAQEHFQSNFIVRYSDDTPRDTLLTSSFINDLQNEIPTILSKYTTLTPRITQNSIESIQQMRKDPALFCTATDIIILKAIAGQMDGHRYSNIRKLCNISFAYPLLFFNPIANIKTLSDLQGKKIFAGKPGNSSYIMLVDLLKSLNIRPNVDVDIVEAGPQYTTSSLIRAFRTRQIDAMFMLGSHPNDLMSQVVREANLNVIGLEGLPDPLLEALYPFSQPYEFNISEYGINLRYRVKTRLFNILLCCDVSQPRDKIFKVMKQIVENFEYIKGQIKTPENLVAMLDFNQSNLISNNFLIMHHEGARDYLRDIGFFTENPDERCGYFAGAGECRPNIISDMRFPNRLMY